MPYPLSCTLCADEALGRRFFEGDPKLIAKPVRGLKPFVFLIGQDPTLSEGIAKSVLMLGKDETPGPMRDWLLNELMEPVGLQLRDIYATNAVKCTFPGNRTPSHVAHDLNCRPLEVLAPFFGFCRKHLVSEIEMIRPRIVISFGKPVHQLLVGGLKWPIQPEFSRAFGSGYHIEMGEMEFTYMPCITQKTWQKSVANNDARDDVYRQCWPQFLETLKQEVARHRLYMPEVRSVG